MKLSIIIPTLNRATVISRALDSILGQTFNDYEILIMDGLSTDDTVKIAESYGDKRIRIFTEPDGGIYDAINKGIKESKGEWLYFLGSDDYLIDNHVLERLFSLYPVENYDVVYGEVESNCLMPENKGEWSYDKLIYNRCHQAIFYKRHILQKFNGYNTKYRIYSDWDLNLKWFLDKDVKHKYFDIILAHYSSDGASFNTTDKLFQDDFFKIVLKRGWHRLPIADKYYYLKGYFWQSKIGKVLLTLKNSK